MFQFRFIKSTSVVQTNRPLSAHLIFPLFFSRNADNSFLSHHVPPWIIIISHISGFDKRADTRPLPWKHHLTPPRFFQSSFLFFVSSRSMSRHSYKLCYAAKRGRAEPIRAMFHYHGVPFEDHIFDKDDWPKIKASKLLFSIQSVKIE